MKVLVLGGGAQGTAAAFDLVRHPDVEHVTVADVALASLPGLLAPHQGHRLALRALDARDLGAVRTAMAGTDAVLCALPYFFNFEMAELAVEAGSHYCDLGGNTGIVERQRGLHARALGAGLSVIPDCGLAPGMVNILAQAGIDALDLVALRVEASGEKDGVAKTIRFDVLDRYDAEHGITAMMRTTGYSLAVTTLMQMDGRIRALGVRTPDEGVPVGPYVSELAARGIRIERTDY